MDFISTLYNKQSSLTISAVLISSLVLITYYYLKNVYSYWEKRGIKGPKPVPVLGNFGSFLFGNRQKNDREWTKLYGKVYGVYFGTRPRLVIAEPDLLQQICIRDFDSFQDHHTNEHSNEFTKNFLIFLKGEHWKKVRALMSPTFTSKKIKRMFNFLDKCADDLVQCFAEQLPLDNGDRKAIVNVKDIYNMYTMDAITSCCYGLKLERKGSSNLKEAASRDKLVEDTMRLFKVRKPRLFIAMFVPGFLLKLINFQMTTGKDMQPLADRVEKLVDRRKRSTKKFDDYLQTLTDSTLDAKLELNELDREENHHAGLTHDSLLADQKKMVDDIKKDHLNGVALNDIETIANGIFLLIVGLETTGTLLAHCTFALAYHQEIQEKLYQEVKRICELGEDHKSQSMFPYDKLTLCKYLDSVISETLRYLSPVMTVDRVATQDYYLEKYNLHLPKGSNLLLSLYAIHNDPEYWPEPERFNPERFMPENRDKIVPGSYCPFGLGPRHCLGMRFSLTEAKLALAKVISKYRFEPAPGVCFPPEYKRLSPALSNIKSPLVTLVPRD